VGLEIFRYSIASSVVKTKSPSINDIGLPPLDFYFIYLIAIIMPRRSLNAAVA